MITPDLSDAYAKLARGRHHIADLEASISAYLATDFYRLRLEVDQWEGRMEVIFDSLHQPNKTINALIGDAIGNLRSALDYLVVALVAPISGKPDTCKFPFADDEKGFGGEVKATLSYSTQIIRDHFINKVQAYQGGNGHALWVLNKLRNRDKHRFLVATTNIAGITVSFRDRNGNVFKNCGMGVSQGNSGVFISAPINHIQFTDKPTPRFEIMLEEPPYLQGAPVASFLNGVASDVQSLLDAIKVVFNL